MNLKPSSQASTPRLTLTARIMRLLSSCLFLFLCLIGGLGATFWLSLPDVSTLADRATTMEITVRDWQGEEQPFLLGPQNPDWTPLEGFPKHLRWAVIVAEDGAFYKHRGFDPDAIREALLYDLEHKRMARGASTITQQLAKNLFLSRDKKISRKLREVAIAWRLEKALSKERILELYLNMVELGPLVHGVTAGARHHLSKPASDLTAAEATFLAAILPGPRIAFNPQKHPARVAKRAKKLLGFMQLRRVLAEQQIELATREVDIITGITPAPRVDPADPMSPAGLLRELGEQPPWQLPLVTS